ncbi:MAG: GvpL/GvpF family gas vesicle protein [Actinobacteria bacterium]|nr:GvpL/GvpF family gas vesicle protein [Actinomycetota bacterium]
MAAYLYGLVPDGTAPPPEQGVGGGAVAVRRLPAGIGVLTSEYDGHTVQPRRANLAAHDRVLAATMATAPVLPFRFGMITEQDPAAVVDGIDIPYALSRMDELEGRVEVQVLWEPDRDVALRRVAERQPEVRDRAIPRMERGRVISEALAELAVEDLATIGAQLDGMVVATGVVEGRGTSARVAALVEAEILDVFLDRCEALARRLSGTGTLRTVGALPPYSFADLDRDPVGV